MRLCSYVCVCSILMVWKNQPHTRTHTFTHQRMSPSTLFCGDQSTALFVLCFTFMLMQFVCFVRSFRRYFLPHCTACDFPKNFHIFYILFCCCFCFLVVLMIMSDVVVVVFMSLYNSYAIFVVAVVFIFFNFLQFCTHFLIFSTKKDTFQGKHAK